MPYDQQTWVQHIAGSNQHHAGLNVMQGPSGVNQRSNRTEMSHSQQNVAKAALEHMLLYSRCSTYYNQYNKRDGHRVGPYLPGFDTGNVNLLLTVTW